MLMEEIFGADLPQEPLTLLQISARASAVYIIGVLVLRLGKSRLFSRLSTLDILLGFILGSVLSRGVTGQASLSGATVATITMVMIHWLLTALTCRFHSVGILLKGDTRLIIENGKLLQKNLKRSHLSEHDLWESLRLRGVDDIKQVKKAYKERSGELSVICK
jgi:uncharacterized membrane protein YcaP (DUF421 family)